MALRESEEKYRTIFESFHDIYYRTDKEGRITVISPSIRTHAGYEQKKSSAIQLQISTQTLKIVRRLSKD